MELKKTHTKHILRFRPLQEVGERSLCRTRRNTKEGSELFWDVGY